MSATSASQSPPPEHLFISYAWEDGALAEWLTLKLTAEGYRVWCDRFKILGGERWPDDIDDAIRNSTFRMLHLVSRYSLDKPNPKKERELALQLERERKSEILIPLNVDGISPSSLPWRIVDVAFIPFENWSDGIRALLKKLVAVNAPRPLASDGRDVASSALLVESPVSTCKEELVSNIFRFIRVPEAIRVFSFGRRLANGELAQLHESWAFRSVGGEVALAFHSAESKFGALKLEEVVSWVGVDSVRGLSPIHVCIELLRKSMELYLCRLGLRRHPLTRAIYFPAGLLVHDKLSYIAESGRRSRGIKACGERSFRGETFRYFLAPAFTVYQDPALGFVATLRIRVHLTKRNGQIFDERGTVSRRKNMGRAWWNKQWLSRQLAIGAFMASGRNEIVLGGPAEEPIVLSGEPLKVTVGRSIDEDFLESLRVPIAAPPQHEEDQEEP